MDFDLTQDQKDIKGVARELLTARSPFAKVREAVEAGAYDDALWAELVELGWPGIAVAEEHGGQGLGAVERAVSVSSSICAQRWPTAWNEPTGTPNWRRSLT